MKFGDEISFDGKVISGKVYLTERSIAITKLDGSPFPIRVLKSQALKKLRDDLDELIEYMEQASDR
jgi:hypothetical protein